jgi:leader peptidase (prepilin peptidase)/N-methyltransferase
VCVSGFLFIITVIISGAFGGGDIKLMAAAGFLLGWKGVVTGFLIGLFVGAGIGIVLMARRKKDGKEHMPFGPSLCIGLVCAVLFGQQLIDWYINLLKSMMPNTFGN